MGSNFASFPTTRFRCVAFCRQETEMAGLPGAASTAHSAIEKMSAATITAPSLVAHLAPTTRRATSERARAAARASHTREAVAIEESSSVSRRASLFSAAAAAGLAAFAVPPTACASAAASLEQVVELTPENFAAEVESPGSGAVFVEFYAPWCPFCQKLEPIWNDLPARLADENVPTKIARMNVDTYVEYGAAYGVTGFPTLMLFKDGAPVGQKTGLVTAEQAIKYALLSDGGDPRSVAAMGPKPALNLVLTGAQVDDALAELEAIERDLDVGGLAGAEREDAERRVKALRAIFAKRSL